MPEYITKDDIEQYLLIDIDESFHERIKSWIQAISNYIDKQTNRTFEVSEDEKRLFDGSGARELTIDDLIKITKIEIGDAEVDLDNYYLYPANTIPKTLIKGYFPAGTQNVAITGDWGYAEEVPEDIKFVCTVLVSGIIQQSLSHEGEVKSESVGSWSITYKDEKQWRDFERIESILERYKRY